MNKITKETKMESFEIIQPEINDRQKQCLNGLQKLGQATANELAWYLFETKEVPYFSRNYVHPRLNELVEQNKVQIIGKKKDEITNRTCAIYEIAKIN